MSVSPKFYFDRGLFLLPSRLALDVTRRQPIGFISHAHMDHVAKHETTLCTAPTAAMLEKRVGMSNFKILEYEKSIDFLDLQLTAHNAGHIFGSAMLHVEEDGRSLLYTGDFRLSESATAGQVNLPQADTLIMECTFGKPQYRLPPRKETTEVLIEKVNAAFQVGATPVIHAYVLGKAQEVTKILTSAGIKVLQHPAIFEMSQLYQQYGCDLGSFELYQDRPKPNHAVIIPPKSQKIHPLQGIVHKQTFSVTGWALGGEVLKKHHADHVIPLSDHADFDELLEIVERVNPSTVYCTHGPKTFVDHLKEQGHDARWLE
ncbi:MAG: MBL fold metallo-hydrolase RNA specificity domain-containing protein [Pirellulales bacterium]